MKRPAFQFYPADWRNDPALRTCSIAARGLWWEMICVMHTCEPYGHLVAAGMAIEPEELARVVGENARDVKKWLAELERKQVFSRTDGGVIYCRRMVRDEQTRDEWRDRQAKSRSCHADVTPSVTPMSRPSSSSTSSSASAVKEETPSLREGSARKAKTRIPDNFPDDEARRRAQEAWSKIGRPDLCASVMDEIQAFRDHHLSTGKTSADWPASWRTWIKNAPKFTPQQRMNGHGLRESPLQQSERIARDLIREDTCNEGPNPGPDRVPRIALRSPSDERH